MNNAVYDVAIIGGGASGFFCACEIIALKPDLRVCIIEKTSKTLAKVKISGGGRCNLTHYATYNSELVKHYPNGKNFLKKVFQQFTVADTVKWFEERGVTTKVEADGRMFPTSNNSQSVIDVLIAHSLDKGVALITSFGVSEILNASGGFQLIADKNSNIIKAQKVVVATGGYPKASQFNWLKVLGHAVNPPVPSLFTFNIPVDGLDHLQGLSVPNAKVQIMGEKLGYSGPLLITHWGLSGPAVLKLSAWGSRLLHAKTYEFDVMVSWLGDVTEQFIIDEITAYSVLHPKRKVLNNPLFDLPQRLWEELMTRAGVQEVAIYNDLGKKSIFKMLELLFRMPLKVRGKTTFKEEFVTSGGINLEEVNSSSMESKVISGLYFTGEVLDIDGITGGYNFQAAWSTATAAATNVVAVHQKQLSS